MGWVATLARFDMNGSLLFEKNNTTNNRDTAPSHKNNSNCYTRGPVELRTAIPLETIGEKVKEHKNGFQ